VTDWSEEPESGTTLTPEEREGLIPSHITLRSELNAYEQDNILTATVWAFSRKRDPMSEPFARNLHKRMFNKVWRWAGVYRHTNKNIGIDHWLIETRLREALDNARYWVEHTSFAPDELAIRFHHALVFIHPFPNGNGRWSRLMADLLLTGLGEPRFTWAGRSLLSADETQSVRVGFATRRQSGLRAAVSACSKLMRLISRRGAAARPRSRP
jgi:Fic-DOC domain mobile mystery protein B